MAARFAYTISRGWIERVTGMPWKKVWFVIFGALLASTLLIAPAQAGFGDDVGGFIAQLFLQVASLFVGIMAFFVSLLINVASYNDFINGPGVIVGWTLVRDIANMFFVVILLLIAFGTILGLDQYHYKKLLPRFVGAAILINFSRLIVGLLIDAAQVIMMTFVNAISQVGGGNFIQAFQINNAWKVAQGSPAAGGFEQIITAMFVVVLIFIAAVLIGMFALLLVLRVVTLWVLVVLSPLAALLYVVPVGDFKKYYDEWWGKFKANVFLGPVVAFFLWLALTMAGDGTSLYAKIKEKGGGKADFTEAGTAAKGITGSAISSIENLSSFVIAAAIFAIAFDMAKKMSAQAGLPGAGAITKAAGGLIKGGVSGLTGYSAAGRALTPAWKQMKEIQAKTALGTGVGKRLERATLATAAVVPGAFGGEAKERLMAARWDDTQKKQQKLKRQTNESLTPLALKNDAEGRAAALELTSRGHRFKPEDAERVVKNMSGDERGLDQLKQNMRKNMPELAYDLSNDKERKAMIDDPSVILENLGPRAFTDAEGRITDAGRATFGAILDKRGTKGTTDLVGKVKDRGTREAMLNIMQERIPTAVVESVSNKAAFETTKTQLAADQRELTLLEQGGSQENSVKQRMQALRQSISSGQETKKNLELRLDEGSAMVEAHVKETGRPDEALKGVTDPVVRQREMAAVLKKVKLSDLKDDALKSPEVIAGMQGAFGIRVGEAIKGMSVDKQKVLMDSLNAMNVRSADVSPEAVQVKVRLTGDFTGVESLTPADQSTIMETVRTMTSKELAEVKVDSLQGGIDVDFYNELTRNLGAAKGLARVPNVSKALLDEMRTTINGFAALDPGTYGPLAREVGTWRV